MASNWYIEHHMKPDDYGRVRFTLHWLESFRKDPRQSEVVFRGNVVYPRGQVFFCDPARYIDIHKPVDGVPPWIVECTCHKDSNGTRKCKAVH